MATSKVGETYKFDVTGWVRDAVQSIAAAVAVAEHQETHATTTGTIALNVDGTVTASFEFPDPGTWGVRLEGTVTGEGVGVLEVLHTVEPSVIT
jgi:hypothetical protein